MLSYPGGSCLETCKVWGDPHIIPFDSPNAVNNFFDEGEYWMVKSPQIWIQARYMATEWTHHLAATKEIIVGGPFLGHSSISVGPMWAGKIMMDGHEILQHFPSTHVGPCPCIKLHYNGQGDVVDPRMPKIEKKHIVHMELPLGVHISVQRWAKHIDVSITMPRYAGEQGGSCGNNNGDPADDSGAMIKARGGYKVQPHELMFQHADPSAHMAPHLTMDDCERLRPENKHKAYQECHAAHPHANHAQLQQCYIQVCFGGNAYYLPPQNSPMMQKDELIEHDAPNGLLNMKAINSSGVALVGLASLAAIGIAGFGAFRRLQTPSPRQEAEFDLLPVELPDMTQPQDLDDVLAYYG